MARAVINGERIKKWSQSRGNRAVFEIMEALNCSSSKGEKIAGGRYSFGLDSDDQMTLSRLTKIPRESLFIPLQRRDRAS